MLLKLTAGQDPQLRVINISAVVGAEATQFRLVVPENLLQTLRAVYNDALQTVFYTAVPLASLSYFSALSLGWRSGKNKLTASSAES